MRGMRADRRTVLRSTAGALAGAAVLGAASGRVGGQESAAAITFEDQESDGDSVVLAELRTSVDALLLIVTGRSTVFAERELPAGTEWTDRTVELGDPLEDSRQIRAELRTLDGGDELLARDRALIAVGESLASARSTVRLPNGTAAFVEPDDGADFHYPYLLFRPDVERPTARPLYVITNNAPPVADGEELRAQVRNQARGALGIPHRLRLPAVVPAFPRTPADGPDHVQGLTLPSVGETDALSAIATDAFPAATLRRPDRQLLAMLEDARGRLGDAPYELADGIHMNGFSASAQFAARFAFLYPDTVAAISVGGNGAYPLPKAEHEGTTLPYPLGTADYEAITDRSFDRATWTGIDQYLYVGEEDQPLPGTGDRGYYPISYRHSDRAVAVFGENRVTERLPLTRSVYAAAGATATVEVYPGVGHAVTPGMLDDLAAFHRRTSGAEHAVFALRASRAADEVAVGTPLAVTVVVENRTDAEATATPTLTVDGEAVGSREATVPGGGTVELAFEHTFAATGSYALAVDGVPVGDGPVSVVEAATPTPTATPTEDAAPTTTGADGGTESGGQPGFGVLAAISAIAGGGYLLGRGTDPAD